MPAFAGMTGMPASLLHFTMSKSPSRFHDSPYVLKRNPILQILFVPSLFFFWAPAGRGRGLDRHPGESRDLGQEKALRPHVSGIPDFAGMTE
jgi:hypothetical protein